MRFVGSWGLPKKPESEASPSITVLGQNASTKQRPEGSGKVGIALHLQPSYLAPSCFGPRHPCQDVFIGVQRHVLQGLDLRLAPLFQGALHA